MSRLVPDIVIKLHKRQIEWMSKSVQGNQPQNASTTSTGLPQLVKKYPKLVDPLMASLLETVGQFHEEVQEAEAQQSEDSGDADEIQIDVSDSDDGENGESQENGDESQENGDESEEKDGKENESSDIRKAVGHSFVVLNSVVFNHPRKMDDHDDLVLKPLAT